MPEVNVALKDHFIELQEKQTGEELTMSDVEKKEQRIATRQVRSNRLMNDKRKA